MSGVQIPLNHCATGIHLRFHRETSEPRMSLGMPNLKRFARPTDWPDLHRALTMFVKGASGGGRTVSGLPPHATLSPIFLRLPGDEGCTIKSSIVLSIGIVEGVDCRSHMIAKVAQPREGHTPAYLKAKNAKIGVQKISQDGSLTIWLKLQDFESKYRSQTHLGGIQEFQTANDVTGGE